MTAKEQIAQVMGFMGFQARTTERGPVTLHNRFCTSWKDGTWPAIGFTCDKGETGIFDNCWQSEITVEVKNGAANLWKVGPSYFPDGTKYLGNPDGATFFTLETAVKWLSRI